MFEWTLIHGLAAFLATLAVGWAIKEGFAMTWRYLSRPSEYVEANFWVYPSHYTLPATNDVRPDAVESMKQSYHAGGSHGAADVWWALPEPLEYVLLGLVAMRDDVQRAVSALSRSDALPPWHIRFVASRRQGKTSALALLAVELLKTRGVHLLWARTSAVPETFDSQLLVRHLERARIRAALRALGTLRRPRRFRPVVFVDDLLRHEDEVAFHPSRRRSVEAWVDTLLQHGVTVIAATPNAIESTGALSHSGRYLTLQLDLTDGDEERLIAALLAEPLPLLVGSEGGDASGGPAAQLLARRGGWRTYRHDLVSFLSILVHHARPADFIADEFGRLAADETVREGLKWIAGCHLLDLEAPEEMLEKILGRAAVGKLRRRTSRWVRRDDLRRTYALGAPFLAEWVLTTLCGVHDLDDLHALYKEMLSVSLRQKVTFIAYPDVDLPRHILHRLGKGRHARFKQADLTALAPRLLSEFSADIEASLVRMEPHRRVKSTLLWAATYGKIALPSARAMAALACRAVLEYQPAFHTLRDQEVVSLADALADLIGIRLARLAITKLASETGRRLLQDHRADRTDFRRNEILHSTTTCLRKLGNYDDALALLDRCGPRFSLDALSLLARARVMSERERATRRRNEAAHKEPESENILEAYDHAVELGEKMIATSPTHIATCSYHRARYISSQQGIDDDPQDAFAAAAQLAKEYEPRRYQDVLCAWADAFLERGPAGRDSARHLLMGSLDSEREQAPHSRTRLTLATVLSRNGGPEDLKDAERLLLEVLHSDLVWWNQRVDAAVSYSRLVGQASQTYDYDGRRRPQLADARDVLEETINSIPSEPGATPEGLFPKEMGLLFLASGHLHFHWWQEGGADTVGTEALRSAAASSFARAVACLADADLGVPTIEIELNKAIRAYSTFLRRMAPEATAGGASEAAAQWLETFLATLRWLSSEGFTFHASTIRSLTSLALASAGRTARAIRKNLPGLTAALQNYWDRHPNRVDVLEALYDLGDSPGITPTDRESLVAHVVSQFSAGQEAAAAVRVVQEGRWARDSQRTSSIYSLVEAGITSTLR